MFRNPQVISFSADVSRAAGFCRGLGFTGVFRVPDDGDPVQIVQSLG
jgi:hypothetical protein